MSAICSKVLQEGPSSPARISQTREVPTCAAKCLSQQRLMFSIVSSSSMNGTNSLGPILAYFWAFPDTSEDNRWTVSSFPLSNLCVVSPASRFFPHFAVTLSFNFLHAASAILESRKGCCKALWVCLAALGHVAAFGHEHFFFSYWKKKKI